ncbi:hypothetical protein [Sphingomonas montanisoli]|uniref:Uncharacterized protein n=1 Tax=Sphingomonas montanisoli TaxID=2606412 RepID=A0A5D9CC37_9SPHN|nr:hypothetical protein [Sphingomonas montanisoli]TZG27681.1 hypothetical protein FYJ91_08900 [Sphingomonas montanisoli]
MIGAALLALATASTAPSGEKLIQPPAPGFVSVLKVDKGANAVEQFVPEKQSLTKWTDMITVQRFAGQGTDGGGRDPATWLEGWGRTFAAACPKAQHGPIGRGAVNNYPAAILAIQCAVGAEDPKRESVFLRAIQGKDAFYVVQFAMRRIPRRPEVELVDRYLQAVSLCDDRDARHPCPVLDAAAPRNR